MAVFFAVVKSVHASPYDFSLALGSPCASAVRRSAFAADQQFAQSVLALITAQFGFRAFLLDLWLAGAPCDFLLDSCKGACVNDGRVVVLNIVFVPLAVVYLDPLADAVGHISVIYTVHMESGKNCWVMTEKLLISQKQSPRKEIRHSGFYARCAVFAMFP